ncbi:uncharacterized protein [Chelonus insularis]|uniref:uncharacterized protein n=1 Tax=Chelonus insularis TaxID=460826 RepID=UPI00158B3597|nr:uncharacterized protein LOC118073302 [Chelonus insularis]
MAVLNDIKPLLFGARIFGCTPHEITDRELVITKVGQFYSFFIAILFTSVCMLDFYLNVHEIIEFKLRLLVGLRVCLYYFCVFADAIITMACNKSLCLTISRLHSFDVATKFAENMSSRLNKSCQFIVVIVIFYWGIVGYLTYLCETRYVIFNGVVYGIVNATMSMQILKFIGMLVLLYQRFQHLDKLVVQRNNAIESMSLQDIRWLHHTLVTSAEEINTIYTTQLFVWISINSLNGLSRIYTLTTTGYDQEIFIKIRDSFSIIACSVNLFIISACSHFTAVRANNIGISTFLPQFSMRRKKTLDNVEVMAYFCLKKLHFSAAAGLIQVDLPLLLTIAGAITTYLVILHAMNP